MNLFLLVQRKEEKKPAEVREEDNKYGTEWDDERDADGEKSSTKMERIKKQIRYIYACTIVIVQIQKRKKKMLQTS